MARAKIYKHSDGSEALIIRCPGCGTTHLPIVKAGTNPTPVWGWNGSIEIPTLTPSVLVTWDYGPTDAKVRHRCHSFIKDGRIQFLNDCTHHLAGQTVDLPDIETNEP